jgi:D-aminopeptidase
MFVGENSMRFRAIELGINKRTMMTARTNTINDVRGVKVGHETIINGEGEHVRGEGPVRTGVSVIFPHSGDTYMESVPAAMGWLNGFGECLGYGFVQEFGFIIGPIVITNSFNVYSVADALQDWSIEQHPEVGIDSHGLVCVVCECSDDWLNDMQGRHVRKEHVFRAINKASTEPCQEGSIGAGTGMIAFEWKGGIGTSSRVMPSEHGGYTVGVMVVTNFGADEQLIINGVPIGCELSVPYPPIPTDKEGSCIIVIATDAPFSSQQLKKLTKRAFLGLGRTGGTGRNGSGDLAIAFSTSNKITRDPISIADERTVIHEFSYDALNSLFDATVEATEEAILNSMLMSDTMSGRNNNIVYGLPIPEVIQIMNRYGHKLKLPEP